MRTVFEQLKGQLSDDATYVPDTRSSLTMLEINIRHRQVTSSEQPVERRRVRAVLDSQAITVDTNKIMGCEHLAPISCAFTRFLREKWENHGTITVDNHNPPHYTFRVKLSEGDEWGVDQLRFVIVGAMLASWDVDSPLCMFTKRTLGDDAFQRHGTISRFVRPPRLPDVSVVSDPLTDAVKRVVVGMSRSFSNSQSYFLTFSGEYANGTFEFESRNKLEFEKLHMEIKVSPRKLDIVMPFPPKKLSRDDLSSVFYNVMRDLGHTQEHAIVRAEVTEDAYIFKFRCNQTALAVEQTWLYNSIPGLLKGIMLSNWKHMPNWIAYLRPLLVPKARPPQQEESGAAASEDSGAALGKRPMEQVAGGVQGQPARGAPSWHHVCMGLFEGCKSLQACLDTFWREFPNHVDCRDLQGGYSRKTMKHRAFLKVFVLKSEELWAKANLRGGHAYETLTPEAMTLLDNKVMGATSLAKVVYELLFHNSRGFLMTDTMFDYLMPTINKIAEVGMWNVQSGPQVVLLRDGVEAHFKTAMVKADEANPDSTTRIDYTLTTHHKRLEWTASFGVNRKGPYTIEQLLALPVDPNAYPVRAKTPYTWQKSSVFLTNVDFEDARHVTFKVTTRDYSKPDLELETPLPFIIAKRCARDTDRYPLVDFERTGDVWTVRARLDWPGMFDCLHITSMLTTLHGIVFKDARMMVIDGLGLFHGGV